MPSYGQNGVVILNAITFDDRSKYLLGLSSDQRLVLVGSFDTTSPVEALAFNPTTNVLSAQGIDGQLVQFVVPRFSSTTLPTSNVTGAVAYATDNSSFYFNNGAAWVRATITSPVSVGQGGTGVTSATSGAYLKGAGTAAVTFQTAPIPVTDGGTGLTTIPVGSVVAGSGTAAATALTLTSGQLVVGSSGAVPVATLPVAGSGIGVATAAGGLTISASSFVLDRTMSTLDVVNTTGTVVAYSVTVPGGTLDSNKMLRLTFVGDYFNNSGGASNFNVSAAYGATTVATYAVSQTTQTTRNGWSLLLTLGAANTTSAQIAYGEFKTDQQAGTGATGAGGSFLSPAAAGQLSVHNAVSIDSSVNQTLSVSLQHSVLSTNVSGRRLLALTELV